MKSKIIVLIIVSLLFMFIISGIILFNRTTNNFSIPDELVFTKVVAENQPFYARFPEKIKQSYLSSGDMLLTNQLGEKINVTMQIANDHMLIIPDIPAGQYKLIIEEGTLKKEKGKTQLDFEVIAFDEKVTSENTLKKYFQTIEQQRNILYSNMKGEMEHSSNDTVEESSTGASMKDASTTNNQVQNIEEGDIAITDSKYLYTIDEQSVHIVEANPLKQIATIKFKDNQYPTKLMYVNDFLIVLFDDYMKEKQMTKVNIYNLSNPKKPELIQNYGQEGHMIGSRMLNNELFIISNHYVYDDNIVPSIQKNGEIREMVVEDIAIYPTTPSEIYTIISKINIGNEQMETKAFLGAGNELYMSSNAIYLTGSNFEPVSLVMEISTDRMMPLQASETIIHKYSFDKNITKVAEATIDGRILNQFSMDEFDGYFRIASTDGNASLENANSNNTLYIFDDKLNQVGKLTDLARGERIYSVRFMGDTAYMVTFKETDPLFVIDVKNPSAPEVLGELKIPGYSNYLHPIDENHLLGIGHDTKLNVDGKNRWVENLGMKLSLFDVSDKKNPIEKDVEIIGGRGTNSEVTYNHHAFFRDIVNNRYGFGISIYQDDQYVGQGPIFYRITGTGIEEEKNFVTKSDDEMYENWESMVKRILYVEDTIYVIKNDSVITYSREQLSEKETLTLK